MKNQAPSHKWSNLRGFSRNEKDILLRDLFHGGIEQLFIAGQFSSFCSLHGLILTIELSPKICCSSKNCQQNKGQKTQKR